MRLCGSVETGRRWGNQPFAPLILEGASDYLVDGFLNDNSVASGQRDVGVRQTLDVLDQLGVEHQSIAVESGELDHGVQGSGFGVQLRRGTTNDEVRMTNEIAVPNDECNGGGRFVIRSIVGDSIARRIAAGRL